MQPIDSWNKIVSQYNKIRNNKEDVVQASWELIFSTLFNYSDSEIDSQRPVQMGSTPKYPDIIIKNQNEDLYVVELKQLTLHKGQEQLISYLNQLKVNIGVLVCNNLYIYDFDYTAKENAYSVLEIPFVPDNPNGSRFVELFSKGNFDKQKIKDFIRESNAAKNAISEIKSELTSSLVSKLVEKYLLEKYPSVDVRTILTDYVFSISPKNTNYLKLQDNDSNVVITNSSNEIFLYNNQVLGKGRFVLNVVSDYIRNHPNITYNELKLVFPDKLQGGFGVFQNDETVMQTVLHNYKDKVLAYKKCYFIKQSEKITLQNEGCTIIVSTQWGHNFDKFFNRAKELGLNVERKSLS